MPLRIRVPKHDQTYLDPHGYTKPVIDNRTRRVGRSRKAEEIRRIRRMLAKARPGSAQERNLRIYMAILLRKAGGTGKRYTQKLPPNAQELPPNWRAAPDFSRSHGNAVGESIRCSFCGGPAHPATGCVYGPRTIACRRCTEEFWKWAREHTGKKARRRKARAPEFEPSVTFYEAAGKKVSR